MSSLGGIWERGKTGARKIEVREKLWLRWIVFENNLLSIKKKERKEEATEASCGKTHMVVTEETHPAAEAEGSWGLSVQYIQDAACAGQATDCFSLPQRTLSA